jgi:hypothetical protein
MGEILFDMDTIFQCPSSRRTREVCVFLPIRIHCIILLSHFFLNTKLKNKLNFNCTFERVFIV